jgi:hypothetical protein
LHETLPGTAEKGEAATRSGRPLFYFLVSISERLGEVVAHVPEPLVKITNNPQEASHLKFGLHDDCMS